MALSITYWSGGEGTSPGTPITSEDVAISGASAQSGAIPANTKYISLLAGEATRFLIGADPTALVTSAAIASGERIWLTAITPGYKIAGIAG